MVGGASLAGHQDAETRRLLGEGTVGNPKFAGLPAGGGKRLAWQYLEDPEYQWGFRVSEHRWLRLQQEAAQHRRRSEGVLQGNVDLGE